MLKIAGFFLIFVIAFTMGEMAEAIGEGLGSLFWGYEQSTGQVWTKEHIKTLLKNEPNHIVSKRVNRFFTLAREGINIKISPVKKLEIEGIVSSDARFKRSQEAVKGFEFILSWSICAAFEGGELASECAKKAKETIRAWIDTYSPDGNPINQSHLILFLTAIDLANPILTWEDQLKKRGWLEQILLRGDRYFLATKSTSDTHVNNWKTWHLALRGMVARILESEKEVEKTRRLFDQHIMKNLNPDGTSFDYHHRDALHYHIYNLVPYIYYLLFTERNLSAEGLERVFKALEFLKPYFLGERQHVEFAKTSIKFDIVRKEAGDIAFQNKPWEPRRARYLLRLSRALFKGKGDFDQWTQSVVDENYSPFIKFITALNRGE